MYNMKNIMKKLHEITREAIRDYSYKYSKLENPLWRMCENLRLYSACRTASRGRPWEDCA